MSALPGAIIIPNLSEIHTKSKAGKKKKKKNGHDSGSTFKPILAKQQQQQINSTEELEITPTQCSLYHQYSRYEANRANK